MKIRSKVLWATFLLAPLGMFPLTSCTFSGDGGGWGSCIDAGHNLTGQWQLVGTYTTASAECDDAAGDPYDFFVFVTQDGTSLQFDLKGSVVSGTVCGDAVSYSYNSPEESGSGSLTVINDELMTGTITYAQSDGCSAVIEVVASPFSPLVTDDQNNTAVVINERVDRGMVVVARPRDHGAGRFKSLGYVEPGGAVVFPLPPGSWDVFAAYSAEGAPQFDYLGETPDLKVWNVESVKERGAEGLSVR